MQTKILANADINRELTNLKHFCVIKSNLTSLQILFNYSCELNISPAILFRHFTIKFDITKRPHRSKFIEVARNINKMTAKPDITLLNG